MHVHDIGRAHDAGYGRNVADEIVAELLVKRCVDRVGQRGQQERVAIGRRAHGHFGPDGGSGNRPESHRAQDRSPRPALDRGGHPANTMYDLPSLEGVEEVVVSKQVVEGTAPPLYIYSENAERIDDASA